VNRPVTEIYPGSLVTARGRDWIVLPQSEPDTLRLRPLGGGEQDESLIFLPLEHEPVRPAIFPWPSVDQARNHGASQLLLDALQLKLRNGAGPFRSFGNIAVEPRAYQLVPLLMALKLATVRLLQLLSDAYFSTQLSCQCIECSHRLLPLGVTRYPAAQQIIEGRVLRRGALCGGFDQLFFDTEGNALSHGLEPLNA
jgi:hypothetical protein